MTSFCVSIGSTWIAVGASSNATPRSITWATMLPTLISSPPDATADARSTPCFCRNRICAAMPPIAGTARFENDIESCSSAVRTSGRLIGTVPIERDRGGEVGEQRDDHRDGSASMRSALVIVSHSSCGLPTWLSRAKTAMSVPIAIIRLVPLTRWSSCSGGSSVPTAAAAAARTLATCFERSLRWRRSVRRSRLSAAGCR